MREALRLDNQVCFALYAASRSVTQAYQPLLEPLGITYPQYLVLLVLWEEDCAAVKRLGERLQLDSGTLTPLLKRMEAQGLVRRLRDAEDERVVRIHLTPAGRALERRAGAIPKELACKAGLSLAEIAELRAALGRVTERLRTQRNQPSPTR